MTSGFRNAAGQDADDVYDPDVVGDGSPGAGFRNASGQNIRYASSRYGQPGGVLGCRNDGGADYGPGWSSKNTANYWTVRNITANGTEHPTTSGLAILGQSSAKLIFQTDGVLHQQTLINNNNIALVYGDVATSGFTTGGAATSSYQVRYAWAITSNNYSGTGTPQTYITVQNDAPNFTAITANKMLTLGSASGYTANGFHPVLHGSVGITVTVDLMDPQGRITTKSYLLTLAMYGAPQPTDGQPNI